MDANGTLRNGFTGANVGLSGVDQIMICLNVIEKYGGAAEMEMFYGPIETIVQKRSGAALSVQGKASLRFFINKKAVEKGLVFPHDRSNPGWRITEHGRLKLKAWSQSHHGRSLLEELQ